MSNNTSDATEGEIVTQTSKFVIDFSQEDRKILIRIADSLDAFIKFIKFAATGGMVLTAIYFILRIIKMI